MRTSVMLLDRLRDLDDQASWRRFFDRYWKLIYTVARRYGFSEAAAQDIVQDTFVTVARQMPQFRYDPKLGSFKGWLLQITRCRIFDALRRTHCTQQGHYLAREVELGTTIMESCPAPEQATLDQIWEEEWRRDRLEMALEQLKRKTGAKEFQIYYLHVINKVAARDVASGLGVKLAQVYAAKYKLGLLLKREVKRIADQP